MENYIIQQTFGRKSVYSLSSITYWSRQSYNRRSWHRISAVISCHMAHGHSYSIYTNKKSQPKKKEKFQLRDSKWMSLVIGLLWQTCQLIRSKLIVVSLALSLAEQRHLLDEMRIFEFEMEFLLQIEWSFPSFLNHFGESVCEMKECISLETKHLCFELIPGIGLSTGVDHMFDRYHQGRFHGIPMQCARARKLFRLCNL